MVILTSLSVDMSPLCVAIVIALWARKIVLMGCDESVSDSGLQESPFNYCLRLFLHRILCNPDWRWEGWWWFDFWEVSSTLVSIWSLHHSSRTLPVLFLALCSSIQVIPNDVPAFVDPSQVERFLHQFRHYQSLIFLALQIYDQLENQIRATYSQSHLYQSAIFWCVPQVIALDS